MGMAAEPAHKFRALVWPPSVASELNARRLDREGVRDIYGSTVGRRETAVAVVWTWASASACAWLGRVELVRSPLLSSHKSREAIREWDRTHQRIDVDTPWVSWGTHVYECVKCPRAESGCRRQN